MSKKTSNEQIESFRAISREYSDTSIFMHEAIAKKAGLTGADHKYIGLLIKKGTMTAGELSKLTGLTTGAITGVIDRLEKKKLLKRQYDKKDRRKIVVVPNTENAMALLGPIFEIAKPKMIKLLSSFSEAELKTIERYLLEATDIMKEVISKLESK